MIQVVCPSSTMCVGVGTYVTASDTGQPLIDTWNGTTWTGQAGALPSNVAIGATGDILVSVSCGSPTTCTAVGGYLADNGNGLGLVDTLSGGTWTGTEAPQPADVPAFASQEADLFEVSCATAASCMAVGQYQSSTGEAPLVDTLSAGAWSGLAAPRAERRRVGRGHLRPGGGVLLAGRLCGRRPLHRHRQQHPGSPRHLDRAALRATGSMPPMVGSSRTPTTPSTARRGECT